MPDRDEPARPAGAEILRRRLARGELVRLIYRLGRQAASGVLTVTAAGRSELFVLRRGHAVVAGDGEAAKKALAARLTRLAGEAAVIAFEGGVTAYPPGASHQVALAGWARAHLESQLDSSLAERVLHELAGARIALRPELAPAPADEADRRMLAAMAAPRRLDQIWPLARTPRFRLLAFLHFLRTVDAVELVGVAAEASAAHRAPPRAADPTAAAARRAAQRLLGVAADADADAVKRAYRRLARALHPDLQPTADHERRRSLERRFAEATAAYESLA